jgi:hypothetical protein
MCIVIGVGVKLVLFFFGYTFFFDLTTTIFFETHIAFINTLSWVETTRMLRQNELL